MTKSDAKGMSSILTKFRQFVNTSENWNGFNVNTFNNIWVKVSVIESSEILFGKTRVFAIVSFEV